MILNWNSDIKYNGMFRASNLPAVTRNYKMIDTKDNSVIATAWARDLHDKRNVNLHDAELLFNGKRYYIPKECKFGTDWEIRDENNNRVMLFFRAEEKYIKEKKSLFSKKIIKKEKIMSYLEIQIAGRNFRLYDRISLGKDKMTYNFYENDSVVIEILQKDHRVNSGCFETIYCVNDDTVKLLAVLYCFYLNVYECWEPDSIVVTELSDSATTLKDTDKYRLSKFSEEFIDRIIAKSEKEGN